MTDNNRVKAEIVYHLLSTSVRAHSDLTRRLNYLAKSEQIWECLQELAAIGIIMASKGETKGLNYQLIPKIRKLFDGMTPPPRPKNRCWTMDIVREYLEEEKAS